MKKKLVIIGGGSAAMMCACHLDSSKFDITIYEKNKALGRKFLVAGKGGFNLTHSENVASFVLRYTPSGFLSDSIQKFNNQDLRSWLEEIGIPTFIGSSKRVYPEKGIKPIEVLKAIESKMRSNDVQLKFDHNWLGWNENGSLKFENQEDVHSDVVIYAFGGGSWKVTGSNGSWLDAFQNKGIETQPFQASNCNFKVDWNAQLISKIEGKPLKNISISCEGKIQKGEAIITMSGIEGNAIYALSPQVRKQLKEIANALVYIDFKPQLEVLTIFNKLKAESASKITEKLKLALKMSKAQIELIKNITTKEQFNDLDYLAQLIKNYPLAIYNISPIDEAISTVGGIALTEVKGNFEMHKMPNHYCIGEMLNWDAPTGGYLLQGCFSMGAAVASTLNAEY